MSTRIGYDIAIWEAIRYAAEKELYELLKDACIEISKDHSLHEFQNTYPVPWQLGEVMR